MQVVNYLSICPIKIYDTFVLCTFYVFDYFWSCGLHTRIVYPDTCCLDIVCVVGCVMRRLTDKEEKKFVYTPIKVYSVVT